MRVVMIVEDYEGMDTVYHRGGGDVGAMVQWSGRE